MLVLPTHLRLPVIFAVSLCRPWAWGVTAATVATGGED